MARRQWPLKLKISKQTWSHDKNRCKESASVNDNITSK